MKVLLASLLFSTAVFGALPPLEQSSRELQAILSNPQMNTLLGSGSPVDRIERQQGGYQIFTENYMLLVEVKYKSTNGKMGPIPFDLVFHRPIALR